MFVNDATFLPPPAPAPAPVPPASASNPFAAAVSSFLAAQQPPQPRQQAAPAPRDEAAAAGVMDLGFSRSVCVGGFRMRMMDVAMGGSWLYHEIRNHHQTNHHREQAEQALGAVAAAGGPPPGQGATEAAITWLCETDGGANPVAASLQPAAPTRAGMAMMMGGQQQPQRFKMVLVVRMDLGMSPGKIAAQCVHGACVDGDAKRVERRRGVPAVLEWSHPFWSTLPTNHHNNSGARYLSGGGGGRRGDGRRARQQLAGRVIGSAVAKEQGLGFGDDGGQESG